MKNIETRLFYYYAKEHHNVYFLILASDATCISNLRRISEYCK